MAAEQLRQSDLVLIEAESFQDRGGWVVDPQFMDQMGSPYLLAHGLGIPVKDASTEVTLPGPGAYRVWVRTIDWVARWNAPGTPGRFELRINGQPLKTLFGTTGANWHWQDGGMVQIDQRQIRVALHDLTGFEGRCDAILLARDPKFVPPNDVPVLTTFRRQLLGIPELPVAAGSYDLIVGGGGMAGTCAAVVAARLGLSVALVQDRPVLGGNNSSEVRVGLGGARNCEPWPHIGDVLAELEPARRAPYGPENTAEVFEDEKKLAVVRGEPRITLFLEHRINGVQAEGGKIRSIIAQSTTSGRRIELAGRWFADCTGDATVGALAGADFEMSKAGHMGPSNLWSVCDCKDKSPLGAGTTAKSAPVSFPRCPWALDLSQKPFPGRDKQHPDPLKLGSWFWESGFDRDPIQDLEYIRDWNFRAMYGAWDTLKNVDHVLPNYQLNWAAYILGKRESRRLLGDVILSLEDLTSDRQYPDRCVPTGWSNDLHLPDPKYVKGFEKEAFISVADFGRFPAHREHRPYWIPFRCLYSRNISNLLMAGRNISVSHDAMGAVRVMRTCGLEGEIIGMAAGLCLKHNSNPRGVYQKHLDELQTLMKTGVGKVDGRTIPYENGGVSRPKSLPKSNPAKSTN